MLVVEDRSYLPSRMVMIELATLKMNSAANRITEDHSWGTIYSICFYCRLFVLYSISLLMSCSLRFPRLINEAVLSVMYMLV